MLKNIILLSGLLVASMNAQAALISHFGYERDSASNIVKGGGLEWLKWDVTKGMSINKALTDYSSQGWRLASSVDMAALFNAFSFGINTWTSNEQVSQYAGLPWDSSENNSPHASFTLMFGATDKSSCSDVWSSGCYVAYDPKNESHAFFGSDLNSNGIYNLASVKDDNTRDYGWAKGSTGHQAYMYAEAVSRDYSYALYGVALVRSASPQPGTVDTPGSIGLLVLGLAALGYRRRQVLGC